MLMLRVCLLYLTSSISVVLMALFLAIDASVESTLTIIPSVPVLVLNSSLIKGRYYYYFADENFKPAILTCKSTGNYNITWVVPDFNFGELSNQETFQALLKMGKQENDLPSRVNITTIRNENDDGFTSTLTIYNLTEMDEGYYTCRTTNQEEIISSRLYIFIQIWNTQPVPPPITYKRNHIHSLRSFYVVPKSSSTSTHKSSIILPCWICNEYKDSNIILERKNKVSGKWEQMTNLSWPGQIQNWTYPFGKFGDDELFVRGLELFFTKNDAGSFEEYRCIGDIGFGIGEPFSILVEGNNESHSNDQDSKPIIRPSVKYLVFQTGSKFKLTCETIASMGNVTWKSPDSRIPPAVKTSKSVTRWRGSRTNKRITVATLTVSNATYVDTGYYTCLNVQNSRFFSEQYVFIQDESTPFTFTFSPSAHQVKPSTVGLSESSFHIGNDNGVVFKTVFPSLVTVGVILTSLDVDVRIYRLTRIRERDEVIRTQVYPPTGMNESGIVWSYNIFKGFSISDYKWDIVGTYEVSRPYELYKHKKYSQQFNIYVEGIEIVSSESHALSGRDMSLQCRSRLPFNHILNETFTHGNGWFWTPSILWFWTPKGSQLKYDLNSIKEQLAVQFKFEDLYDELFFGSNFPNRAGYLLKQSLIFTNLTMKASGTFGCNVAYDRNPDRNISEDRGLFPTINTTIEVLVPKPPVIVQTIPADGTYFEADTGQDVILSCQVDAFPAADILWINNKGLPIREGVEISSNETWTSLKFRVPLNFSRNGEEFTCSFTTLEGSASKTLKVVRKSNAGIYVAISLPVLIVVIVSSCLLRSIYLTKKRDKMIRLTRKRLLLSGDSERINPDIPLEEQVDHLPYDPKWEFPPDRLILGKQLGAGQFGVVVQAQQIGTVHDPEDNKKRQVAIKMIKSTSDPTALASLVSELKILIHLGHHLNVVNLLGACTKEIVDGKLLVIEEFCQYGNVRDYLIKNRDSFIDELNEIFGVSESQTYENVTIKTQQEGQQQRYFEMSHQSDQHKRNLSMLNEPAVAESSSSITDNRSISENKSSCIVYSDQCAVKYVSSNPTVLLENDGYLHPSNELDSMHGNPREQVLIRTKDLICWSFQIASGMNHLATKKVIHGDLAARNVLLAAGNVVKVADFGLSRQTKYTDGTYFKQGEEALPVKWMAIESLTDRKFTTQSDVWSFGVVLWELFSLGQMPYAEIPTSFKDLIRFLQNNGRLEKPSLMPIPVSDLMMKCWQNDPKERPDFSQLKTELGNMLEDDVHNHFLKMMDHP